MDRKLKLMAALEKLAEVPDIAEELHLRNIRGKLLKASACPVANWLKKEDPAFADIQICSSSASLGGQEPFRVYVPARVGAFIQDFDDRKYPHLIA